MFHIALISLLLTAEPSQTHSPTFKRPGGAAKLVEMAAGYQAIFTCAAHFHAKRSLKDILEVELIDLKVLKLPLPDIDEKRQLVRARDHDGHVMVAAYRKNLGCTLLPPHWSEADLSRLPYIEYPPPPKDLSQTPFPMGDKAKPRPRRAQKALLDRAFDGRSFGEGSVTVGIVIVKNGQIAAERYRPGFGIHSGYRTWSTAKSISATLIAIAIRDGLLKLNEPAPIPEWQFFKDPRQAITIAHLLHMSSGLWSEGSNTNAIYFGGQDVLSAATTTPLEAPPNTRWKYANNDTLLLLRALRARIADDNAYLRYPYEKLLHPLGMHHTRMEIDHKGNFVGSSQVYTTARDLARFGLLYLHKGLWADQRLLSEQWVEYVSQPAPALPSQKGRRGYGAQFWLLEPEGGPKGSFTTAGNKGQYVTIVPDQQLVIVRTGVDPSGKRWKVVKFVKEVVRTFAEK